MLLLNSQGQMVIPNIADFSYKSNELSDLSRKMNGLNELFIGTRGIDWPGQPV